jgi:hypothetical protein
MAIVELDARTDVYSLACVVYEMLVGETPAMLPTPDDTRLGRFLVAPAEHRQRLDALPGRVEQALVKALSVQPGDRHATPGEFAEALAAATERGVSLTDSQVREILKRAAELQAEQPTQGGALSIGAVEQVAAEVGIPPQHVRQAMRELEPASGALTERKIGHDRLLVDRTVDGEVPVSAYMAMVEEIEKTLGIDGHVSTLGSTLTWSPTYSADDRKLTVSVSQDAGRTRIRLEERVGLEGWMRVSPAWGAALGGLMGAAFGAVSGLPPGLVIAAAGVFAVAFGIVTADSAMRASSGGRREQLEKLADRLAALAGRTVRPGLAPGP